MTDTLPDDVIDDAAAAAEGVVFDAFRRSEVTDLDVTIRFEDGILEVDVYINADDESEAEVVAEEAVAAATSVVDAHFDSLSEHGQVTEHEQDPDPGQDQHQNQDPEQELKQKRDRD